jgi:hypothetical protein
LWFWPRGVIPERRRRFPGAAQAGTRRPLTRMGAGR